VMGHVERQNQGGHVLLWDVLLTSGATVRVMAQNQPAAALEALRSLDAAGVVSVTKSFPRDADDALRVARRALAEARTKSAKGGR
jgi:hypothetical protein